MSGIASRQNQRLVNPERVPLLVQLRQVFSRGWKQFSLPSTRELQVLVMAGVSITGLLLGIRQLGGLEPLELAIYDQMMRLRPAEAPDSRLVIVAIGEEDLRSLKQYPFSDQVLAETLRKLQQLQPGVIGLDLFRDIPHEPGHSALAQELSRPNVVVIHSLGNTPDDAVPAPVGIPRQRVGFVDIVTDADGVVRRSLMFANDGETTLTSFSMQTAILYLRDQGEETAANEFRLGKSMFSQLQTHSGGYQTVDDRGYQILLNYRSGSPPAPVIRLTQLLQGQVDRSLVKGRIALIGTTAPSLKDSFYTPFSTAEVGNPRMPGVMIHAQMTSQYLTAALEGRSLFWYWSDPIEVLWIIAWAIAGGSLAWWIQRPLILIGAGTGLLILLFCTGYALFVQGGWVPVAAPAFAAIAMGSFIVAHQVQHVQQQQQIVMKLLGQQTSPEIASALWNSRDRLLQSGILGGQSLTATILFIDICGFSAISEQRSTEVIMGWLNEFMQTMTHEVHAHHGIVNKFMGDGLMAVFGVPIPRMTLADIAADAQQAVDCAVAMGDRLQELNDDWQQRDLPVVAMRVGIYTGSVMAGSLGGKNRLEYAVIGDSVNVAARLESCEKDRQTRMCRILIARETLDYLHGFEVVAWGEVHLRGRQKPVEVYEVLGYT